MAENPLQNQQSYQAPLEVGGYVNPSVSKIPSQPIDLYGLFNILPSSKSKLATRKKSAYEIMMDGNDPYATLIPDVAPSQTNLKTIEPLDDPAGLFHSQDGFGKYGYSTIMNAGDNEDRYSKNFKRDNPDLFYKPGFHPWDGIKKGFYWGGGFLEKTLESAVVKTGQGIAGLYGVTLGNTLGALTGKSYDGFEDWLSSASDNIYSSFFNNWDENLKNRYHYFQEKEDRDRKGFIASLGDGDFWMNDISDGLGFLTSAAFEVGLISKLGLGTKLATRLSPLAEGVSTDAIAAGNAGTASGLQKTMNLLGIEGSGHMFIKNAVDLTAQTLATTAIESASEANEVKQKVLDSFEGKTNPETGYLYSDDEKQRLAAAAAAETFKQNMTILIGPKFLETLVFNRIGKFAKGMFNKSAQEAEVVSGKASGQVRSRLGNLSSGTSYDKASALKNIWKVGSTAAVGFLSEGLFEENIQLAISRTAEQDFGAGDEFYRPGTSEKEIDRLQGEDELFGSVGRRYINQTRQFFRGIKDDRFIDDELSKSVGIGGLFGVVGGGIHAGIGVRQQNKIDNYWNNRLNAATANLFESQHFYQTRTEERPDPQNPGKTKPTEVMVTDPKTGQPVLDENKLRSFLNKMNNIQGIMDIVNNTEDPDDENNKLYQNKELNKLARNVLFTQLAMEYIRAGKKNLLLSNLTSASQFSDKDVQALGYQPGFMSEQDKKNMLAKMTGIVERLAKADDWIENNVLDNVSEPRQGYGGIKYTKTQKERRALEFDKKKAYLRGLAMQNALLDSYLDDITLSEANLGEPQPEILSSVLDENGVPVTDLSVPLDSTMRDYNRRLPALKNQIAVLQREFGYHWDNILSQERNSPKAGEFNNSSKTNSGKSLVYNQIKAQETLEKINDLQSQIDDLNNQRNAFLNNDKAFQLIDEDGNPVNEDTDPTQNYYVAPKSQRENQTLDQINDEKIRRINGVKREEIGIQKKWIEDEWKQTAALKEEKTRASRPETRLSRRMSGSLNAYNTYFQREVMDRDNSLGQRKLRLYDNDPNKRVNAKKYKANEDKLLKAVRIQGKVATILADINGKKLMAELESLLDRDLGSAEFTEELKKIIDNYNGRVMVLSASDKDFVNDQIESTEDERNFVSSIYEFMPEDDRFNDKYYDIDQDGRYVIKSEYDSLADLANVQRELQDRIDDLSKIKKFLNSVPSEIPGDWNDVNLVRKRIADVYTETADSIINTYNQLSNNGQSEISGDSLSSKQDLDLIDQEINELGQLKQIFSDRNTTDRILTTPPFSGYIEAIDKRIEDLKKIRELVKERLNSRLRENQDFLVDMLNNLTNQLGVDMDGIVTNQPLNTLISNIVSSQIYDKFVTTLRDLKTLIDKPDQTSDDKKAISDAYWSLSGNLAAIQEVIKSKDRTPIQGELAKQKKEAITKLESTALMQRLKSQSYYKDIINNIDDSVLGALQLIFYQSEFSQVGVAGNTNTTFLDDQPSSPIYKFREDYNLRKLIRGIEKDDSRTPDNTEVSKDELLEFLNQAQNIQNLEDLSKSLDSSLNMLDQIEKEKEIVQAKIDKKDNKYENLIISSIQQLYFIRNIANFIRRETIKNDKIGFRNWIYIQAPGGAGKTQTLGTWFDAISGIPRDRVLATAFTEEAARGIKKALLVGEEGPKDAEEMISYINELIKNKQFNHEVLIIDEFPAISVNTQKALFEAVSEYTKQKLAQNKGEFKVITMGDTNQLTFSDNGSVIPRPSIIVNPNYFNNTKIGVNDNHPAKMNIIPSLTVNFRSNLFAITSFVDQFKGSTSDNVNQVLKVTSTDSNLDSKNVKGVVSVNKADFKTKIIDYLKLNNDSIRTRALIVNETKLEEYKKLLTDNGIKVIIDPNDEVTKGVYVTTVKNSQGFSFDEVFIDLENNDKTLFSGTSSLNYIYNKAMYVAASRARNLVVVTNFPNFENVEDDSINTLENKALDELQTKDTDFLANRNLEIDGAKALIGSEYNRSVRTAAPVKAEDVVETPLDQEEDKPEDVEEEDQVEELAEEIKQEPISDSLEEEIVSENTESQQGEANEVIVGEVVATPGVEDNVLDDVSEKFENTNFIDEYNKLMSKIKDPAVKAFDKIRDNVVELLFPTAQSIKYKVTNGEFTTKVPDTYENRNLRDGDRVVIIPFQQSKTTNSPRKFGYAVVSNTISQEDIVNPSSYKTIAILSDTEIDRFKEKPETKSIYDNILENEKRDKGFVSILYSDVNDENGFTTGSGKVVNEIQEGIILHANSVRYFFNKDFKEMNKSVMDGMIENFIKDFYRNHLESFPISQQAGEYAKIRRFYENPENAQIIIPTNKDVEGNKPLLRVPPELRTYVRAGRPYMMFRPFHKRSSMQFIALSRRYLNIKEHNTTLAPIRDFINLGKVVRTMLEKKGVTNKLGYSKSLSNMLSRLSNDYIRNPNPQGGIFKVNLISTIDNKRVTKELTFSVVEAERIYNLFSMYSQPNTQMIEAKTEKEIENLTKVKKARNFTFEDGETIYGIIESYDPNTKTFVVKDIRSGETQTKSGVISHTGKSYVGQTQQALDDIMNSNGNIASKFTSIKGNVGFVTDKDKSGNSSYKGYKFMALLGSKTASVVKSYDKEGKPKEYYSDVIDILEDLFNFRASGELPGKTKNYIDENNNIQNLEVKFRVPVPLNARDEAGELEHDYTYSPQNTSRDTSIPNTRFFESNFETLLPTRVLVDFTQQSQVQESTPKTEEQLTKTQEVITPASQVSSVENLTKDEINSLNFNEIEQRLNTKERKLLDDYAKKEGFNGVDHFFRVIESSHPEEQAIFKDYIIECLL